MPPSSQPNQSLITGLSCLQAVVSAERPLGSRELSRMLGIDHARANRLLKTLAEEEYVVQNAERKYLSGPAVHLLSAMSLRGSGLLITAMPFVRELQKQGLLVALGTLWQSRVCYLYYGHKDRRIEQSIAGHELAPIEQSSIGLLLSAFRDCNAGPLTAAQKKQIRSQGYADLKNGPETHTIAVPVGAPPVAGLSFSGTMTARQIPGLVKKLKAAAEEITVQLAKPI